MFTTQMSQSCKKIKPIRGPVNRLVFFITLLCYDLSSLTLQRRNTLASSAIAAEATGFNR